jgi:hypothetical protein
MFKSFIIIAVVCSPYFECMEYEQKEKKIFRSYKKCAEESEWIGQDIYDGLVKIGIPFTLKVYCEENKKWQV